MVVIFSPYSVILHSCARGRDLTEESGEDFVGPHITIHQPPRCGLLAITPTTDVAFIRNLTIAHPKNLSMPLLPLPLPQTPSAPTNFDDLVSLVMTLRESLSDPRAAMPNMASVTLPWLRIPTDFPVPFGVKSAATPHWNPMNAISRQMRWSVRRKGSKQLSSIRGAITLPTVSTGQGALPP
ncbi:hypothetical protein TSMEX_005534 [Taenia solium]|eukprot:TsM_000819600 transcript=TsM_000819600 gene=TsM_000819600